MSLTISAVWSWDLDTVAAQIHHLKRDDVVFRESADAVRHAVGNQMVGLDGHTVTTSSRHCAAIARDLTVLARKSARLASILDAFLQQAVVYRSQLLAAVDAAGAEAFSVADDGSVRQPALIGDPEAVAGAHSRNSEKAIEYQAEIMQLLRELEGHDLEAANGLNLMSMAESYDYYPFSTTPTRFDPRTAAASTAIGAEFDLLHEAAEHFDTASPSTRALPVVGSALELALGVATAPEDEPLIHTLIAEGSGLAVSAVGGGAAGAAAGSVVPGIGTAAGLVGGAAAGLTAAPRATDAVREYLAGLRSDGKVRFRW